MKANRNLVAIFLLLLPILGGVVIAKQSAVKQRQAAADLRNAQGLVRASANFKLCDCRLFGTNLKAKRKKGIVQLSNAIAVKYLTQASTAAAAASAFSTNAPLVYDGSVGDMSTGYTCPTASTSSLCILYDLGSSPPSVSKLEIAFSPGAMLGGTLYSSPDGTTWTSQDTYDSSHGTTYNLTSSVTARYWQFVTNNPISSGTYNVTDSRLYDGSGVLIGGPVAPSAPTGLTATANCSGSISLAWTASSGATSYDVYRGTVSGGPYGTHVASGLTGTTYNDTNALVAGQAYYYVVTATNSNGTSGNSTQASATALSTPAAPTGVSVSGVTNTQATISWSAVTGAASYNVKRAAALAGPYSTIASPTGTTYTDTGLSGATGYYYEVTAVGSGGCESSPSTPISTLTEPNAPTSPSATALCGGTIALSWTAPSGSGLTYNVFRGTASGGPYTLIASGIGTTSYSDAGPFTAGASYYYVISSSDSTGAGPVSTQCSASALVTPPVPANVAATGGGNQIALQWAASTNAQTYNVKRATASGGPYATIATVSTTTYTDTGLPNNTTYYYEISALYSTCESANSAFVSARTYQVNARSLIIRAPGYVPDLKTVVLTENTNTRLNDCLEPATDGTAALYGSVHDVVSNAAVAAQVKCGLLNTVAGQDGTYLIKSIPVPPDTEDVNAQAVNYYPADQPSVPFTQNGTTRLDIGLVSTSTPVGAMTGYVFDAGNPATRLPGALVTLGRYLQAITGLDGLYLLQYVPSGVVYHAVASVEGYLPKAFDGVLINTGQQLSLDFPLVGYSDWGASGSLTVTVLQAGSNQPLSGATVKIGRRDIPAQATDSTGTAAFAAVPPGGYTVAASLTGYRVGSAQVSVMNGQAVTVTVYLTAFPDWYGSNGQVYGWVTGVLIPPGQGIAGCLAYLSPQFDGYATTTDSNGFYVIDRVPAGLYSATFDDNDYVPDNVYGVLVTAGNSIEVDAELVPWDGRLPNGWRLAMFNAQTLSRKAGWVVATLDDTPSDLASLRAKTLPLASTHDTTDLGRFRRVRWNNRSRLADPQALLKFGVGIAPLTTIPGVAWMAIAKDRIAPENPQPVTTPTGPSK